MPQIIRHPSAPPASPRKRVVLEVDRQTLAKRRWQATAPDGTEFGFDLESHLHNEDTISVTETAQYVVVQKPEPLLAISLRDATTSAVIAWSLGNLHFPIEVKEHSIHVVDDPAVRQFLERDKIPFQPVSAVFHPIKAVASHGHH